MPPALGTVLFTIGTYSVTIGTVLLVAGSYLALRAFAPKPPGFDFETRRAQSTIRAAVTAAKWRIGRCRFFGVLSWVGYKDKYLSFCILLGEAPMRRVRKVWVGGRELDCDTLDGDGKSQSWHASDAAGHQGDEDPDDALKITVYLSGDAQAIDPQADDSYTEGMPWDRDSFKMQGLAFAIVRLRNAEALENRWWQGIPEIEWLADGLRATPPGRAAPITIQNAADVRWWWETQREGEPADRIDPTSYAAAREICARYGYQIHGTVEADDDPSSNRAAFDLAWDGGVVDWAGLLRFWPGTTRAPVATIPEAHVIELPTIVPAPELSQRYNVVTAAPEILAEADYSRYSLPPLRDTARVTRDGGELVLDLGGMEYVTQSAQIHRLRSSLLHDLSGARITIRVPYGVEGAPWRYLGLAPGEVVRLDMPAAGLDSGRRWRIVASVPGDEHTISLTLQEEVVGRYPTTLTDPPEIIPITEALGTPLARIEGLTVTRDVRGTDASGRQNSGRGVVVWMRIKDSVKRWRVQIQYTNRDGSTVYRDVNRALSGADSEGDLTVTWEAPSSAGGIYDLRVRAAIYVPRSGGAIPPAGSPEHERTPWRDPDSYRALRDSPR